MDDELFFRCDICNQSFDADPDTMLTVEYSSYLVNSEDVDSSNVELAWEGGGQLFQKPLPPNAKPIKIPVPPEFSNLAICICKKCQTLLLPVQQ